MKNSEQKEIIFNEQQLQNNEFQGKENIKMKYQIFQVGKERRSCSSDNLRQTKIRNIIKQNLSQIPKKGILKQDSSFSQKSNSIKTESDSDNSLPLLTQFDKQTQQDTDVAQYDNILLTPTIYKRQFQNYNIKQRSQSCQRQSNQDENNLPKRVQFSKMIRKIRGMYDESSDFSNNSQLIDYTKVNSRQQSPLNIHQNRSNLLSSPIQINKESITQKNNQSVVDQMQIDTNFKERLFKKLNQTYEKKEELKKQQHTQLQPIQIKHLQPIQQQTPIHAQQTFKQISRKQYFITS